MGIMELIANGASRQEIVSGFYTQYEEDERLGSTHHLLYICSQFLFDQHIDLSGS